MEALADRIADYVTDTAEQGELRPGDRGALPPSR
jgi:hypothetical protein